MCEPFEIAISLCILIREALSRDLVVLGSWVLYLIHFTYFRVFCRTFGIEFHAYIS